MLPLREILCDHSRSQAEELMTSMTRSQYLGENRVLCSILGGRKFFAIADDVGFSTHMIADGFWEFWLSLCFARHIRAGDTVLDVGANLGYYTLLAAELVGGEGRVIAVEPNPHVFRFLCDTMGVNGFGKRVTAYNAALGASANATMVPFFVPRGEPKNGRVLGHADDTRHLAALGDVSSVPTINAEALDCGRVDFIKIDVEGAELDVLASLSSLTRTYRPKIVCEVNFARGYTFEDVSRALGGGRELHHLDYDGDIKPLTKPMTAIDRQGEDWLVCANF